MSSCDLEIVLERPGATFQFGDTVSGVVGVAVKQSCKCTGLTVVCEWYTHGAGNTTSGSTSTQMLFEGEWKAGDKHVHPFELKIGYGPLPYHGHYLNVDWRIKATAAIAWGFDPVATSDLSVVGDPTLPDLFQGPSVERGARSGSAAALAFIGLFGLAFAAMGAFSLVTLLGVAALTAVVADPVTGIMMALMGILVPAIFIVVGLGIGSASILPWLARRRLGTPKVKVEPELLRGGDEFTVDVQLAPTKTMELTSLYAVLLAREKAISGSGTNTHTHLHKLVEERIPMSQARTLMAGMPSSFRAKGRIPTDPAPSFGATDNALEWSVEVHAELPRQLDWSASHALVVRP